MEIDQQINYYDAIKTKERNDFKVYFNKSKEKQILKISIKTKNEINYV